LSSPEAGLRAAATWPRRAVRVRVPATSANLGPGFDALGLALTLYDEVEAEITDSGLAIEVSGEGAAAVAAGEGHLVVRAMRTAFAAAGAGQPPGLALRCVNAIPQRRGLGSSAGAVVAGLLAGRALAASAAAERPAAHAAGGPAGADGQARDGGAAAEPLADGAAPFADGALLGLAAELEGHPDNAAACLAGGLTIAWNPGAGSRAIRLDPLPAIIPVVCVPAVSMATAAARRALPVSVPHADAAANAGRSALLVVALTQAPDLLLDATMDLLHEPYRAPLMPGTAEVITRLRGAGIAAVLSGAGPSVLALTVSGKTPGPEEVDSIVSQTGKQWHVTPLDVDRRGAAIQPVPAGVRPRIGDAGQSSPDCWSPP
jgi:homoserine kinase